MQNAVLLGKALPKSLANQYNCQLFFISDICTLPMSQAGLFKRLRHRFRTPLIRSAFNLFAKLPLPMTHRIGRLVGWLMWISKGQLRSVSAQNIAVCLPHLSKNEQRRLTRLSLLETGKTMCEVPLLWTSSSDVFDNIVNEVHGQEHVDAALAEGKGLLMLTPHLGAWEVAGLYLSRHYPMATMYRPSHVAGIDDLIQKGRTRFGAQLIAADLKGVRQLYQALRAGKALGILPDQDPGRNNGEYAPFFGIKANTMTLVTRIIQKSGAPAIVTYAKRLADGKGFNIYIYPAPKEMADDDSATALAAMNKALESVIKECPEQYQWSYKRFKTRPVGEKKFYQ